jgi:hypothetical protein
MAITVKHSKVSTIPDGDDSSVVRPSDWNDDHVLTGTIPVANGGTGAATLTGYVKGNGTAAMTAATTIPSTDITGLGSMSTQNANNVAITGGSITGTTVSGYIPTTEKAQPLGVATLDAGGKVPQSQIPLMGDLNYQGTWNASTNTPTLTSSVGTKGYYYVVDVAGSTNLNGITDWQIGDWAIFNGSIWQKVDNTDAVTSVNGQVGTVVLTASSVGAVPTTRTITAGTGLTGGGDLSADRTFAIDSTVATLTGTQTLTNKTLTSPKVNEILDANGNEVLGLLSTASATDYVGIKNGIGVGVPLHISSEGSSANIGLHIQPKGTGLVTISDGTDFNKGIRFRSSGSAASAITLLDAVSSAGHVVTLPDATTTLVGRGTTDTLTNKSISGSTNTLSNIGNSSLTNSAITINGTSTSLGGSINVGTVTSVTGTSPVVSSGGATPAISLAANYGDTQNPYASKTANFVLATPNGSAGVPTFRAIVAADIPTLNQSTTGSAATLTTGRTIAITGDLTYTSPSFNGSANVTAAGTLATVNANVGAFTNASVTVNAKGLVTAVSSGAAPVTSVTGTAPVVSSGGATPAISMAAATGSVNGYLTSTDWTTFNGKANAFTYTTNYIPYGQGTTTPNQSANFTYNGTTLTAQIVRASNGIVTNSKTIGTSFTIPATDNASSAGPVTINSGVTITVSSGSRWVVS